ncbi:MAG: 8-oxo-dGTP diphosphatase MutT [Bacteroidetes bacterium]|nr:MAG: 8-oxo-dGTP diphosphatase MutT [Bacteroidota bacterium]
MIEVVCAIIRNDEGKIFIARRATHKSMAGKWEFPGGKIEEGETPQEALKREMEEGFGVTIEVGEYVGENVHHYPTFSIRLIAYEIKHLSGEFALTDHDQIHWATNEELKEVDLAEADVNLLIGHH